MTLDELKTLAYLSATPIPVKLPDCYAMVWKNNVVPTELSLFVCCTVYKNAQFDRNYKTLSYKNKDLLGKYFVNTDFKLLPNEDFLYTIRPLSKSVSLDEIIKLHRRENAQELDLK
jgi:hypothetical protein